MVALRCLLALVLALPLAGAAPARPLALLPPGAVVVAPEELPVAATEAAKRAAEGARQSMGEHDDASAWAALQSLADPLAFELAAADLITTLQAGDGSAAGDRLLARLADVPTRVFHRHAETAAHWYLPLFDVGARAKSALVLRARAQQREDWRGRFEADAATALGALAGAGKGEGPIAAEAVPMLGAKAALNLLAAAKSAPQSTPSPLWRALAERLKSADAFAQAAEHASDADLLALIPTSGALPDGDALRWLDRLGQRPELASAALLAIAPRAAPGSPALARLVDALDDPALGASAASALARRTSPDRIEALSASIAQASPQALTHIALALRLIGTAEADRVLSTLREDPRLPGAVRRELSQ